MGAPVLSPDRTQVAYAVTSLDAERNGYRSHLYLAPVSGAAAPRQMTDGAIRDAQPAWSPDGRQIGFLSNRSGSRQVWLLPVGGGEPVAVTAAPAGVSDFAWSPDGSRIAFVTTDPVVNEQPADIPPGDYMRIRRIKYRADGVGVIRTGRKQIWVTEVIGQAPARQLTIGDYDHTEPTWAPDGASLYCCACRRSDAEMTNANDIWQVGMDGLMREVFQSPGPLSALSVSTDGRWIAFFGHDNRASTSTVHGLWVVPTVGAGGQSAERSAPGARLLSGELGCLMRIVSDVLARDARQTPLWSADSSELWFNACAAGAMQIYRVSLHESEPRPLTAYAGTIYALDLVGPDQAVIAISEPQNPSDLWVVDLPADGPSPAVHGRRLTEINPWLREIRLAPPERRAFTGALDWPIEGWLVRPPGAAPGGRHPLILQVHGGPHFAYGCAFHFELQLMAARGYMVLYANPRGSYGYGQAFCSANDRDWGGNDYLDLLAALEVTASLPEVDGERLGVTGGSYGGFMTNWIITHTDRFRAAVTQRSLVDFLSFYGTSDTAYYVRERDIPGTPWSDARTLLRRSPLTYVQNCRTPLLIIHSEHDFRAPVSQAEELYLALKRLGKTVEFARFRGDGHTMASSGKPGNRLARLRLILEWFDRYLSVAEEAPHE